MSRYATAAASASPSALTQPARNSRPPNGNSASSCVSAVETMPSVPLGTSPSARTTGKSSRHCPVGDVRNMVTTSGTANANLRVAPSKNVAVLAVRAGFASVTAHACLNAEKRPTFWGASESR